MSIRKKNVFVMGGIFIVGIIILALVCNNLSYSYKLDEVSLKYPNKSNGNLAIFIEKEDESGYEQVDKFPTDGYIYNSEKSGCSDTLGNKIDGSIEYISATNTVKVKTKTTSYCYIYFDLPKPILANLNLDLTTNGTTSSVPTSTKYTKSISCDNGSATYDTKYNRVVFSSVSSPANCTLNYQTDNTDYDTLIEVIQAEKTRTDINDGICSIDTYTDKNTCESNNGIWWGVYDEKVTMDNSAFVPDTTLSSSDYLNVSNTGTTVETAFTWDDTNKTWTSNNKTDNNTEIITFNVNEGYYQLCYTMSSEQYYDYGIIKIDGIEKINTQSKNTTTAICNYLGKLTSSNVISVSYMKDSIGSSGDDEIVFYLQSGTYVENIEETSIGLRYEGLQPNNHVWFNNEIWRIIGYVPTKDAEGNDTQLVKIIRNESIGGLTINSGESTYVGSKIYNLLNTYYYERKDGTKSLYCYGYSSTGTTCNYENIGLSAISRNMIVPVQWAIGLQGSASNVGTHYATGVGTYTNTNGGINIGLMNTSDYGYSVIDDYCARSTSLSSYDSTSCAGKAWLYGQGQEWTLSPYSSYELWFVHHNGGVYYDYAINDYAVRPVLYLDAGVYKISGTGTMADPYMIGITE